jgi:FtsP/CotA-like multicopper oxidase with cupredoxin domain
MIKASARRRTFIKQLTRGVGVIAAPSTASYLVSACGDGGGYSGANGGGNASANGSTAITAQDLAEKIKVTPTAASATLRIQARQVQWVPSVNPIKPNAWVYVQTGVTPAGILGTHYGPTFNVRRDTAFSMTWVNEIPVATPGARLLADPPLRLPLPNGLCGSVTLQSSVALVTHLHGIRAKANSDGSPIQPMSYAGNPYGFPTQLTYSYPNVQRGAMLWYHDHALDNTGQNVHAGLVGLYFIRDGFDDRVLSAVGGANNEIPIVLQDRVLNPDQVSIDYAATMLDTATASRPEALGQTIFVNGHPAGDISILRAIWRLRVLNASNSRTYALALYDPAALASGSGHIWYSDCLHLIGADGGLLSRSVSLSPVDVLLIAPGQRRDIVLDLTTVDYTVRSLRLVNLSIASAVDASSVSPEAIFTTLAESVLKPSLADYTAADQGLYSALDLPLAFIGNLQLQFPASSNNVIFPNQRAAILNAIETSLTDAAPDTDFAWNGVALGPKSGIAFGPNRFVLPISNTEGFTPIEIGNSLQGWGDVQLFEMQDSRILPSADNAMWQLPFAIDLATPNNPAPGNASASQNSYSIARRSFFQRRSNPDITIAGRYPALHTPTISAKGGTYERWYVANIGNSQPLTSTAGTPDMHPFHIHLVNFVVTRRWELDAGVVGGFTPIAPTDLDLDRIARQDTVLIPSGQIVELLVYYPAGYAGDFMYHCHLLEHEDKCMMSTYRLA